jgi:hypothetical protein
MRGGGQGVSAYLAAAFLALCLALMALPASAEVPEGPSRAEAAAAFDAARRARAAGRYHEAIPALRALLRYYPDAQDVREELGYALLLDGQYAAAQYLFQILAERSPNPAKRDLYRAVLRRIVSERPFGLRLVFALVPSSNLNGGADGGSFDTVLGPFRISDETRAQEGWRLSLGLAGYAQQALSPRDLIRLDWSVLRSTSDLDVVEDSTERAVTLTYVRAFEDGTRGFVALGLADERARSERRDQRRVDFGAVHPLGADALLRWRLTRIDSSYEERNPSGAFVPDTGRSGPLRLATLRHEWLLPRTQSVWIGLQLEDSDPERAALRYDGRIFQVGGKRRFASGLELDGILSYGDRDFTGNFDLQTFPRRDTFWELTLSAQHPELSWQGFAPRVSCTARRNSSNIALFDATTHECGVEFTRRF